MRFANLVLLLICPAALLSTEACSQCNSLLESSASRKEEATPGAPYNPTVEISILLEEAERVIAALEEAVARAKSSESPSPHASSLQGYAHGAADHARDLATSERSAYTRCHGVTD